LSRFGMIHINPHFPDIQPFLEKPATEYSASKLAYDICSHITSIKNLSWIAALGIIGDNVNEQWETFLSEVCESFSSLKATTNEDKMILRKIADIIESGPECAFPEGSKVSLQALLNAEQPEDILEGGSLQARRLLKLYAEVMIEMERIREAWNANVGVEFHENLQLKFFEITPGMDIHSKIATELSNQNPNLTVVVVSKSNAVTHISFRRQDGSLNCGTLAWESTSTLISARGGGHRKVSGATIQTNDIKAFKQEVVRWIENHYSNSS